MVKGGALPLSMVNSHWAGALKPLLEMHRGACDLLSYSLTNLLSY